MRKIMIAVVGLAVLAGCGGGTEQAETTPEPAEPVETTSEPAEQAPALPQSMDSVYDLRAAVESVGYACVAWDVVAETSNAVERAHCTDQVVLSIHTDATQAQRSVEELAPLLNEIGLSSVHLTGPNWSINCGQDERLCEQFSDVLGGVVQVFSPKG